MADRDNHYEAAFEDISAPRRAVCGGGRLPRRSNWLS